MHFMETESGLQTKKRSEPAKNRFSVALVATHPNFSKLKLNTTQIAVQISTQICRHIKIYVKDYGMP